MEVWKESVSPSALKAVTFILKTKPSVEAGKLVIVSSLRVGMSLTAASLAEFTSFVISLPEPSSLKTA